MFSFSSLFSPSVLPVFSCSPCFILLYIIVFHLCLSSSRQCKLLKSGNLALIFFVSVKHPGQCLICSRHLINAYWIGLHYRFYSSKMIHFTCEVLYRCQSRFTFATSPKLDNEKRRLHPVSGAPSVSVDLYVSVSASLRVYVNYLKRQGEK